MKLPDRFVGFIPEKNGEYRIELGRLYNGQLILHCKDGKVVKLERREIERVEST